MARAAVVPLVFAALVGCTVPGWPQEPAPSWSVGDAWSYELRWLNGTLDGRASFRVVGLAIVLGQPAYQVEERLNASEVGHQDNVLVRHFVVARLHQVFDVCGQAAVVDDCQGRLRELDFPLWEGKRWTRSHLAPLTMEARREANGDWRLVCLDCPEQLEDVYRPSVGLWAERIRWTADGTLRWVLEEPR